MSSRAVCLVGLLLASITWFAPAARAGLGGDPASVEADAAALGATVRVTAHANYRILEISGRDGSRLREFVDGGGRVFAAAWHTPGPPDLGRLLGTRYPSYVDAVSRLERPGLRRDLRIAGGDWVVESGGHLRAYAGRAYLPAWLPAGTSAAELR